MKSPIRWLGGKGQWADHIVDLLPPHRAYVEPFGGGASVLFAKVPSPIEVYNDIDSGLVNFFRVLRDPDTFERFQKLVMMTPYSREEFYAARDTEAACTDPVERARRWFVVARQNFGGTRDTWGMVVDASQGGMGQMNRMWLSTIERLPEIHARLMRVQIEHRSWEQILDLYDRPEALFYLDPPYVPDTRAGGAYLHELSHEDHERLVEHLLRLNGKALLSGYPHAVYQPLEEAGWQVVMRQRTVSVVGGSRSGQEARARGDFNRTDTLWISPSAITQQALWTSSDDAALVATGEEAV